MANKKNNQIKAKLCIGIIILFVLMGCGIIMVNSISNRRENLSQEEINVDVEPENAVETIVFSDDTDVDILTRHALPAFERMEENDRQEYVESLQVIRKINNLGLEYSDFIYPEKNLAGTENAITEARTDYSNYTVVDFYGTTSEELQKVIDDNENVVINVKSDEIHIRGGISLDDGTCIEGNGVKIKAEGISNIFVGDNIKNVSISGLDIDTEAEYGFFFVDSKNIEVTGCTISNMSQKPICIIGDSDNIIVRDNYFSNNMAGGIYLSGDCSYVLIENNTICDNGGTSNWMAGIVLTNVVSDDSFNIWETFDEQHHFPYKENLYSQTECPHEIIIRNNTVSGNNASGIYSDGAYKCYVIDNTVQSNDKEGICLDYGTIGFYLTDNLFDGNGRRIRQTDEDLIMDFVYDSGRMEDGSAKSKLPGVSLDNTAYNIIINNIVSDNYGGGIKMVRTTVRNLIMENVIKDNNNGKNDIYHFFGIELGAAIADVESTDMDFTPDYENIICRNIVSGLHYSGIFLGAECYSNDLFDNIIMEPEMFAVEALSYKFNSIINNYSNASVRNEYVP
jgi:parallel beta-helix repeat protein